jgi:hypothetical protein
MVNFPAVNFLTGAWRKRVGAAEKRFCGAKSFGARGSGVEKGFTGGIGLFFGGKSAPPS